MPLDPNQMINSFEARADEQTQRTLRLSAALETASVTLRSEDGGVTVRVNSAGGLDDLRLHPESDRLSRDEVAQLVLATSRRAQARLAEEVSQIVSSMYGGDSDTAALITDA